MAPDLHAIDIGADVVGVVDHPVRQPQEALFHGLQVCHVGGSRTK